MHAGKSYAQQEEEEYMPVMCKRGVYELSTLKNEIE